MMKRKNGELPFFLMFFTLFFPSISSFYTTPDMFNAGMTTTGIYDTTNFGKQTTTKGLNFYIIYLFIYFVFV